MKKEEYVKILNYLDENLWDGKTSPTNFNYYGLILDVYFDDSVLSIDYINIYDYFDINGGFKYTDSSFLAEQFEDVNENQQLLVIENILNILHLSHAYKDESDRMIAKTLRVLDRNGVGIRNLAAGNPIKLIMNNIIGIGSYCIITKVTDSVYKKELNSTYRSDPKIQKRIKYEYENMNKLKDFPNILNVYSFDVSEYSYLMEAAEMNLYDYLMNEKGLSFDKKTKIVFDILNGMKAAHDNNIIHRDLHLGNILKIQEDFVLCDFGLSKDESIVRSLKSSSTEKNDHIFRDPLAAGDFTKLDRKSDIYSVGKIIDYIFTINMTNTEHMFTSVVERCISRNKSKRYDTIDEIIADIDLKLQEKNSSYNQLEILKMIRKGELDIRIIDLINVLVEKHTLCSYLIKYDLNSFGKVICQLELVDQIRVLEEIRSRYIQSTGYRQFQDYDVFTNISYNVCMNIKESSVYSISHEILQGCAKVRFTANDYLLEVDQATL